MQPETTIPAFLGPQRITTLSNLECFLDSPAYHEPLSFTCKSAPAHAPQHPLSAVLGKGSYVRQRALATAARVRALVHKFVRAGYLTQLQWLSVSLLLVLAAIVTACMQLDDGSSQAGVSFAQRLLPVRALAEWVKSDGEYMPPILAYYVVSTLLRSAGATGGERVHAHLDKAFFGAVQPHLRGRYRCHLLKSLTPALHGSFILQHHFVNTGGLDAALRPARRSKCSQDVVLSTLATLSEGGLPHVSGALLEANAFKIAEAALSKPGASVQTTSAALVLVHNLITTHPDSVRHLVPPGLLVAAPGPDPDLDPAPLLPALHAVARTAAAAPNAVKAPTLALLAQMLIEAPQVAEPLLRESNLHLGLTRALLGQLPEVKMSSKDIVMGAQAVRLDARTQRAVDASGGLNAVLNSLLRYVTMTADAHTTLAHHLVTSTGSAGHSSNAAIVPLSGVDAHLLHTIAGLPDDSGSVLPGPPSAVEATTATRRAWLPADAATLASPDLLRVQILRLVVAVLKSEGLRAEVEEALTAESLGRAVAAYRDDPVTVELLLQLLVHKLEVLNEGDGIKEPVQAGLLAVMFKAESSRVRHAVAGSLVALQTRSPGGRDRGDTRRIRPAARLVSTLGDNLGRKAATQRTAAWISVTAESVQAVTRGGLRSTMKDVHRSLLASWQEGSFSSMPLTALLLTAVLSVVTLPLMCM